MSFKSYVLKRADEFEIQLAKVFEQIKLKSDPDLYRLYDAMEYSLLGGGKRIRPIILMRSYKIFGGKDEEDVFDFAMAIECIHNYSLVHDDLPALDNDDYRRGRLSSHKAFGEDIAILVGDALLNMAYELMSDACKSYSPDISIRAIHAMKLIAKNAGVSGMVGGQAMEIFFGEDSIEKHLKIEYLKTAKLFEASILAGAILAGTSEINIEVLREYAQNIGIAFQIKDDIMDKSGPYNASESKIKANEYVDKALAAISKIAGVGDDGLEFYRELAMYMVSRAN